MTRRELERQNHMIAALAGYGITEEEARKLRRISMTLNHWHELECGTDAGAIERDEQDRPRFRSAYSLRVGTPLEKCPIIPDREKGAIARLKMICAPHKRRIVPYVQGDPRGCALYMIRLDKLRKIEAEYKARQPTWARAQVIESCYSSVGIAVY